MSDLVLLTGISGFLGGHVALSLLNAGYRVRGSVRNLDRADKVKQTIAAHGGNVENLEFVALDLLSDDGWDAAMVDVKYLMHTASPFVITIPDDRMDLIRPAVDGTKRAIKAALAADVKRIVLTSSIASIAYGHGENPPQKLDASHWTNYKTANVGAYIESKTRAEETAWSMMEEADRKTDLTVVNPGFILGPLLDEDPGTSGALIVRLMNGSTPAAPDLQFQLTDVRDTAQIHVNALTDENAFGARVPTCVGFATLFELGSAIGEALPAYKSKVPRFVAPNWFVKILALFDSSIRMITPDLGRRTQVDNQLAQQVLGREMIDAKTAVVALARSVVEQKLI